MNILDKIVINKKREVEADKQQLSVAQLESSSFFKRETYSFRDFLLAPERTGIIAEFKRKSPSKGIINDQVKVTDVKEVLFKGLPSVFKVGRYHSWVVSNDGLPADLEVTAIDELDGSIMALRHKTYDVRGVQFHPESILTEYGKEMMQNWLASGKQVKGTKGSVSGHFVKI